MSFAGLEGVPSAAYLNYAYILEETPETQEKADLSVILFFLLLFVLAGLITSNRIPFIRARENQPGYLFENNLESGNKLTANTEQGLLSSQSSLHTGLAGNLSGGIRRNLELRGDMPPAVQKKKAISPIIAIIIILLITISIAGAAYSYISIYWTTTGENLYKDKYVYIYR